MAHEATFFNSLNGDRKYTAESFCNWLSPFFTNGLFDLTDFKVEPNGGMEIVVNAGRANVNGHMLRESESALFMVNLGEPQARIDNVVIRLDMSNRDIYVAVVAGTPGENPQPPDLIRDSGIYELKLAEIHVPANAISLLPGNIIDTRQSFDFCGFVSKIDALSTVQQLAVARNINVNGAATTTTGGVTGTAQLFDGSADITIKAIVPAATQTAAGALSAADKVKLDNNVQTALRLPDLLLGTATQTTTDVKELTLTIAKTEGHALK